MENLINWFEIPATDFERAVHFYQNILDTIIQAKEVLGTQMGFFSTNGQNVSGAIVKGSDYNCSTDGSWCI
jgi:uncharacterized protein